MNDTTTLFPMSTHSIKVDFNNTECINQESNPARIAGLFVSSIGILENLILLIAIIVHWPKFLSNLYRFVASLISADLLVSVFSVVMHILKFYDTSAPLIAFSKGGYSTMHMVSTFSVSLVNVSVYFTYSRFTTRIREQTADKKHTTGVRKYFRKPIAAYVLISGIWLLGLLFMIVGVTTRCSAEKHDCIESCSTVTNRSFSPSGEGGACQSRHCNKFLAPLSSYYSLSVIILFWVSFVFLVTSTFIVVCVKVNVNPTLTMNNGSFHGDDENDKENKNKELPISKNIDAPSDEHYEESSIGSSVHYTVTRDFGFNRDIMSRFSLLITITQCIFWIPVTVLQLYTVIKDETFSTFLTFEIIMVYFALPTILNPWICVLTMSKLREAIFYTYYKLCH